MDPMTTERAPSWGSIFRDVACTFRTSSVWNVSTESILWTGIFMRPEYFVVEYSYCIDWIFCSGMSELEEYLVLHYSCGLNVL
jgi:hypothetical protein